MAAKRGMSGRTGCATRRSRSADGSERPAPPLGPDDVLDELCHLAFDSIHEGVFTVDEKLLITSFNAAAERIVGLPRDAAIGRPCREVFRAALCEQGCALRRTLHTGQPQTNVRIEITGAHLRRLPISVSTAALRDGRGRLVGGVEIFRDLSDIESLRQELKGQSVFAGIVGESPSMRELFRLLPDVAASSATVLIEGPSGTGKELVARAIHTLGERRDGPFVRVNCGALPDTLLESELFGHVRGAFTGALRDHPGRFVQADHGTIFLDEIGDVSPAFQVKLLRVLQDGELQALGSPRSRRVDTRVIAATHRDLAELVREGRFREDLYYRVRVVPIRLTPLRERRTDIPLLVDHFVRELRRKTGRDVAGVTPAALAALYDHDYPGNVRELENALERAFVLGHGPQIAVDDLPLEMRPGARSSPASPPAPSLSPARPLPPLAADASPEARALLSLLEAHRWSRTRTAAALGVGRNTLWRRMKALGLLPPREG